MCAEQVESVATKTVVGQDPDADIGVRRCLAVVLATLDGDLHSRPPSARITTSPPPSVSKVRRLALCS